MGASTCTLYCGHGSNPSRVIETFARNCSRASLLEGDSFRDRSLNASTSQELGADPARHPLRMAWQFAAMWWSDCGPNGLFTRGIHR